MVPSLFNVFLTGKHHRGHDNTHARSKVLQEPRPSWMQHGFFFLSFLVFLLPKIVNPQTIQIQWMNEWKNDHRECDRNWFVVESNVLFVPECGWWCECEVKDFHKPYVSTQMITNWTIHACHAWNSIIRIEHSLLLWYNERKISFIHSTNDNAFTILLRFVWYHLLFSQKNREQENTTHRSTIQTTDMRDFIGRRRDVMVNVSTRLQNKFFHRWQLFICTGEW